MILVECVKLQQDHILLYGGTPYKSKWAQGLITHLLEITHQQCLYRNVIVHVKLVGTNATARKEELQA